MQSSSSIFTQILHFQKYADNLITSDLICRYISLTMTLLFIAEIDQLYKRPWKKLNEHKKI